MNNDISIIGKKVKYWSRSGKVYEALITDLPINPYHKNCLPTVSLEFRDERGKLVRKDRVLPKYDNDNNLQSYCTCVYQLNE